MSNSTATAVAKINNVNIVVIENGEQRIAVKPICEALGVDADFQIPKLKNDEIIGQLCEVSRVVAADGKEREMVTIPFKYVFGWMFSINQNKVRPEAKEALVRYKKECYDALYDHFSGVSDFVKKREATLTQLAKETEDAEKQLRIIKDVVRAKKETTFRVSHVTYQEYIKNGMQLSLDLLFEGGTED